MTAPDLRVYAPPVPAAKSSPEQRRAFADALRLHLGEVTQAELARRIGVAQQAIGQWLACSTDPVPANVFAAEKALGLPPGALSHVFGYLPVGAWSVEAAIGADPMLDAAGKATVLRVYRSQVER